LIKFIANAFVIFVLFSMCLFLILDFIESRKKISQMNASRNRKYLENKKILSATSVYYKDLDSGTIDYSISGADLAKSIAEITLLIEKHEGNTPLVTTLINDLKLLKAHSNTRRNPTEFIINNKAQEFTREALNTPLDNKVKYFYEEIICNKNSRFNVLKNEAHVKLQDMRYLLDYCDYDEELMHYHVNFERARLIDEWIHYYDSIEGQVKAYLHDLLPSHKAENNIYFLLVKYEFSYRTPKNIAFIYRGWIEKMGVFGPRQYPTQQLIAKLDEKFSIQIQNELDEIYSNYFLSNTFKLSGAFKTLKSTNSIPSLHSNRFHQVWIAESTEFASTNNTPLKAHGASRMQAVYNLELLVGSGKYNEKIKIDPFSIAC